MKRFVLLGIVISLFSASYAHADTGKISLVHPNQIYSYTEMLDDITELVEKYPDLVQSKVLAKTKFDRDIVAVRLGKGEDAKVVIAGSHHAREHMTTNLVMEMIDEYTQAFAVNGVIDGFDVRQELTKGSIWFIPMVNPDGVMLQQEGLKDFPEEAHTDLVKWNNGSTDFTRWKANAEGIDPNRQYPAAWDDVKDNTGKHSWAMFKGSKPQEIIEVQAVMDLTNEVNPEMVISYHSSGEVLYWWHHNKADVIARDRELANELVAKTGYLLMEPKRDPSGGGYTDWFIKNFGRPAFTPEIGEFVRDQNLPIGAFSRVWKQNNSIGLWSLNRGYDLWLKRQTITPEMLEQKLILTESVKLYMEPSFTSKYSATLLPQTVTTLEKRGNWHLIHTWLGQRWIFTPPHTLAIFEKLDARVPLSELVVMYDKSFRMETRMGTLAPQELIILGGYRAQGWYQIHTWLGPKWVILPGLEIIPEAPVDEAVVELGL
jgi:g-D-glutamyl-meso-diaminopimelate peptidase